MGLEPTDFRVAGRPGPPFEFPGGSGRLIVSGREPMPANAAREDGLEAILGATDRRIRVRETDVSPWSMVCALRMRFPGNPIVFGTGWCAGRNLVVTAGHCLYAHEFGGWAERVEVVAGLDEGPPPPFGTTKAKELFVLDEWKADPARAGFDIGAVVTDRPIGDAAGWFGFAALTDATLIAQRVNTCGYPSDKGGRQQWFAGNRIASAEPSILRYDLDTLGGQSGSPIWVQDEAVSGPAGAGRTGAEPLVVGIHAYGAGYAGPCARLNHGPRLTRYIVGRIAGWREAADRCAAQGDR